MSLVIGRYRSRTPFWILVGLLGLLLLGQGVVASGLGGFVSEKLVVRQGVTTSDLLIGRDGVPNPSLDIGIGPSISTLDATGVVFEIGGTAAALNGDVVALNGFPSSYIWFEWGYTPSTLTNRTPTRVVAAVGPFSEGISGFAPGTIYYRFAGCDDGTNYGVVKSFSGSVEGIFPTTQIVLFIWIGIVVFMVLAGMYSGIPLVPTLIVGAVLVILGMAGVDSIMGAFNSWWGG